MNRAASTHYYALFHELANMCANFMIGEKPEGHGRRAWQQVYRALEHAKCKHRCRNGNLILKFPPAIQNFANHFVQMQERRHQCDYDPLVDAEKETIAFDIETSITVIENFKASPEVDRRAFCALVLFDTREDPVRARIEKEKREADEKAKIEKQKADGAAKREERKKAKELKVLSQPPQSPLEPAP